MVNIPSATEVSYQHIKAVHPVLVMENVVYLGCVGSVLGRKFATLPIVKSEKYQSDHNQLTGGRCEKCNKCWGGP